MEDEVRTPKCCNTVEMAASSAKMLQIAGKTDRTADPKKIHKRKTIIPKTIRTHYIIWHYIIYIYIIHVLHQTYNICQYIHYTTLHYTTLPYATLHYTTVQYITLHTYIHTYIFTFDIHTRMYILRMIYIYIDTQCIHIYYVHIWNQLGAAPAGCAWWLWHCSVDSGPCKRLNSQCHGSILISEENTSAALNFEQKEILSSAETFSEFLKALRSKFTTGSTLSLKFHHRKFRRRKRAYCRPGLKIHWFLHWIAPFMFLFLPLYFSLLFCDLYKK